MQSAIVSMPVTIEQVAVVVRSMSRKDRQRLLELVPELRETLGAQAAGFDAAQQPRVKQASQDQAFLAQLREEIAVAYGGGFLSPDEPLLDDLTLGDYLDLSEAERAQLWEKWEQESDVSWEEVDVRADALPAR
jgi:hypothetical protein